MGAASKGLVNIWVDVDKNRPLAAKYKLRGIPAVIFLDPDGKMALKYDGDRSAGSFIRDMNQVTEKYTR